MLYPELWFCCINPVERQVWRGMQQAFLLTLYSFVPVDVWNALWLFADGDVQRRKELFLVSGSLSIVTMEIGSPPVPTDVVVTSRSGDWILLTGFLLTPEGACLDGCQRFTPP